MPEDSAVELCEMVARVGWPSHAAQHAAIMDYIVAPAELRFFGTAATRTQQRNYVELHHHLPERIWSGPNEQFISQVCECVSVDLGMQNASEGTLQKIVALLLLVTEGRNSAAASSWKTKRGMIDVVKKLLKQYRYWMHVE